MKLEYTSEALQDLALIEVHGEPNFGSSQNQKCLAKLEHAIGLILENPKLAMERLDTLRPVRIHPVSAHLLIYEIITDNICILSSRQNWRDQV